ncbi:MAG: type II toxin-antitoxin system prevent-host-death family antitoxin [Gemmatales bacterium]
MNTTIGSYDAKTRLSELLERVQNGEEITITRHGNPVARLIPVQRKTSETIRRAAVLAMRGVASRQSLRGLKVKDLRNEGRR